MKKIYKIKTLAVMAMALMANVAFGQTLKVTAKGEPVKNGDVITAECEVTDYSMPESGFYWYDLEWNPHLEVSVDEGSLDLTVTVTNIGESEKFLFCWPQECLDVNPGESKTQSGKVGTTPADLKIDSKASLTSAPDGEVNGGSVKVKFEWGSEQMEVTVKTLPAQFSGVDETFADSNEAPEYFTIDGVRVAEPRKGQLVIERRGSKVAKRIF